ncbi:hypothetical protein JCM19233_4334 [Vibrio astriarenae]|nr:hypothetical protein JCM19233_4334 [Vibrio sp. C7]
MKLPSVSAAVLATTLTFSLDAKEVEITLANNLDGYLDAYCLDVVGNGRNIDVTKGLQVHTCYRYQGSMGQDQTFDDTFFSQNKLYLSELGVCIQATDIDNGAILTLAACDDIQLQSFSFNPDGTIRPLLNEQLCFTAGLETKRGRGGTSDHQIKPLTLHKCSEAKAIFQIWKTR